MIEKLKELYEKYDVAGSEPRPTTVGDAFRGWFSGKGREQAPVDSGFMKEAEQCVLSIREDPQPGEALEAVKLILSRPRTKKFNQRDLVFAAMYARAVDLLPLLNAEELRETLAAADEVPKPYRFPVYKELRQKAAALLEAASKNAPAAN